MIKYRVPLLITPAKHIYLIWRRYLNSLVVALFALSTLACESAVAPPISLDGLVSADSLDQAPPPIPDMSPTPADRSPSPEDMRIRDQAPPPEDVSPPVDMEEERLPDGSPPMGDPCDPRLRAPACEPGFSCLPIPGGRVNQGRCVESDLCSLTGESGCPEDAPYCHLRGRGTECTQPSTRGQGEVCLDEFNRALPCAAGLVCNFSVCVPPCDPTLDPEEQCGQGRACVDLTAELGQPGGFCGAIGACDLFTNEGCEPGQQCNFAVRADDQELVYFCNEAGSQAEGEPCQRSAQVQSDCGPGLICIGSPEGDSYCKRLCDTGAYQAPCPENQSCREILNQGGGFNVRSIGLCVVNR